MTRVGEALRRAASGLLLVAAAACGGGEAAVVAPPVIVLPDAMRGVTVAPASASVMVGQTLTLLPTADPAAASVSVTVGFTSAAPAVATVSLGGVVTGVTPGTATITVTATGIGAGFATTSKTTTATITVTPVPLPDALRGVTLPPSESVSVGQTFTLAPVPDVAAPSVLVSTAYTSATPSVATVSLQGVVTGVSVGTAVLTVTATGSGPGFTATTKTATTTITVTPAPDALRGVVLTPITGNVLVGQTLALAAQADVAAASVNVSSTFISATPAVATVSAAGVVTGVSAGTAVVTVSATGSGVGYTTSTKTATATITVSPAPDALRSVRLTPLTGSIVVGSTLALTAVPDVAASSVTVTNAYASSAPAVATVSAAGLVTGVAAGTAVVTVTTAGSGTNFTTTTRTATATITVSPPPDALRGLTITPPTGSVTVGRTLQLVATPDAAAPNVSVTTTYSSSEPAIASVSASGVVTGGGPGTTTITVTATGSGSGFTTVAKTATVPITVAALPVALRGLTMSPSTFALAVGRSLPLTSVPDVAGSSVTVSRVYSSSAPSIATVSASGIVVAVANGTAVITVTATGSGLGFSASSRSATATVTVVANPALLSIAVSPIGVMLPTQRRELVVTPSVGGPNVVVTGTFTSGTPGVATVSQTGEVVAVAVGNTDITVTATGRQAGLTTATATAIVTVAVRMVPPGFNGVEFAPIPAGSFTMGSTLFQVYDERPPHTVTLSAFRMQRTEVTYAQYYSVMAENPSYWEYYCNANCPVEQVSWDDAQLFVTRLNALDPGKGYRLPTEAEWEYAARAGTTGDFGGNGVLGDMGWFFGNNDGSPRPGGSKRANAFGLYDMHGNVFEWVQDWFGPYSASPVTNPTGPSSGRVRVTRGGSYDSSPVDARSSSRGQGYQYEADRTVGFRLVRNP